MKDKTKDKVSSMRINEGDLIQLRRINETPASIINKFLELGDLIGYQKAIDLIDSKTMARKAEAIKNRETQ